MELEKHIEAVLFYKAGPMKKRELCTFFEVDRDTIEANIRTLKERLVGGVTLLVTDEEVQLVTPSETANTIDRLKKEELSRDIGKAGAETLAIILYRGPITRSQIDLIRGVNSAFILRNLLMRGLIERITHPTDKRQFQYRITAQLFAHLGITQKEELPDHQRIVDELDRYEKEQQEARETEPSFTDQ